MLSFWKGSNVSKKSNCNNLYDKYHSCLLRNLHERELASIHCEEEFAKYSSCIKEFKKLQEKR